MDFCIEVVKDMMQAAIQNPSPKNTILSPLSFNLLFNMIAAGMTGDSLELMLMKLKSDSVEEINKKSCEILAVVNNTASKGPTVTSINGVWVDKSCELKVSYEDLLKSIYNCETNQKCDFKNKEAEVRKEINSWADAVSRGLIKNVLDSKLDPMTQFVRANALYFKGKWSYPFDPYSSYVSNFYLLDETTVKVLFMRGNLNSYDYGSFDGYSVLKLPYENGPKKSFSMYFLLPDKTNGLPNLLEAFNSETMSKMQLTPRKMDFVGIPKFKFSFEINATDTMKKMGLEMPYKGNQLDYAEMMQFPEKLPHLHSTVIQKAFIEIDEYGTEASAVATQWFSTCGSKTDPNPKFDVDHPFMFVIKEDISGLVLFTGIVLQPDSSTMQTKVPPPNIWEQQWAPPLPGVPVYGPPPRKLASLYMNQE